MSPSFCLLSGKKMRPEKYQPHFLKPQEGEVHAFFTICLPDVYPGPCLPPAHEFMDLKQGQFNSLHLSSLEEEPSLTNDRTSVLPFSLLVSGVPVAMGTHKQLSCRLLHHPPVPVVNLTHVIFWSRCYPFHPNWLLKSTSVLLHPEHHLNLKSLPPITSIFTLPGPQFPAFRITGIADPTFGSHLR